MQQLGLDSLCRGITIQLNLYHFVIIVGAIVASSFFKAVLFVG